MTTPLKPDSPELLKKMYLLFRDYFDRAEKKRRWSLRDGIPWDQCNRSLNPAIADVVETFCCVELYLPDYVSKLIPQVRANRGRAWMLAYGSEPSEKERTAGLAFLTDSTTAFAKVPPPPKNPKGPGPLAPEAKALAAFCQALLSSNKFLYID